MVPLRHAYTGTIRSQVMRMVDRKTLLAMLLPLPFAALPLIIVLASMAQNNHKAIVSIDTSPGQSVAVGLAAATATARSLGIAVLPAQQPQIEVAKNLTTQ
jgi:ABC-type Na+ efflux pump permease subunit